MNKKEEINKFIEKFNKSWSKFNNMSLRTQLEHFYDQIKDNPVPSIDNLFNEFSKQFNTSKPIRYQCVGFGNFILSKLQNGVETDKEKPKILAIEKVQKICEEQGWTITQDKDNNTFTIS